MDTGSLAASARVSASTSSPPPSDIGSSASAHVGALSLEQEDDDWPEEADWYDYLWECDWDGPWNHVGYMYEIGEGDKDAEGLRYVHCAA